MHSSHMFARLAPSCRPKRMFLTEHGAMEAGRLYEPPFTDLTPHGPNGLIEANELEGPLRALQAVRAAAVAA